MRQAIADRYAAEYGLNATPAQVIVSPGGKFSCYLGVLATCSPGDEVIVCSHTMQATASAVHAAGAKAIPVEVGNDGCIDPREIESAITAKTRAIMPT